MTGCSQRVIEALAASAPLLIERLNRADSCVLSSRIGLAVLRRFNVEAEAIAVDVFVMNRVAANWRDAYLASKGREPSRDEIEQQIGEHSRFYAGGTTSSPLVAGKFSGHLVILTNSDHLIDLTIGQLNRPLYAVELPPTVTIVSPSFIQGDESISVINGCLVRYKASSDFAWKTSPDWTERLPPQLKQIQYALTDAVDQRTRRN